ncbi:hypothetical protein [Paramicrobacterium agarici]|uniref:DUF5709 domain-containing protein n=1 Tax=Paramicrobacterium agarici TaxID=630514 RepID=A0A2A9DVS1_9MICO|nr:hypothetical protein [Microbacterium agarici]PFG30040.1 hypothetical protein ATJ78_0960 [Microbacterium agarici]
MNSTPDAVSPSGDADAVQPLRDDDATSTGAQDDAAQQEWERTDGEIPAEDPPRTMVRPETQGVDPVIADLGDEGEGDLAPEDA